jgi:hypothetical protein
VKDGVFSRILNSEDDLEVTLTATRVSLQAVASSTCR